MMAPLLATLLMSAGPADDLAVRIQATGTTTIYRGENVPIEARLVNTSSRRAWWVVRAGDGSESAWREPHIWYSGEVFEDGQWKPLQRVTFGRCGLFDFDWPKDALELRPKRSIPIEWLPNVSSVLDFPNQGRVRFRVHYAWGRGASRAQETATPVPDALARVPAFEIASNPIEVTVESPLRLTIAARGPLRAGQAVSLADVLTLRVDADMVDRAVVSPTLSFEVRGAQPEFRPSLTETAREPTLRAPATLVGPDGRFEGTWRYPDPETIQTRAQLAYVIGARYAYTVSDWITVEVR